MYNKSLKELSASLHRKEISSVELSHYFLDRIARFDGELNSVITINTDAALKAAEQADKLIASGDSGLLTGIPLLHKDIFCTEGLRTSCGSNMLDNFIAPYTATAVRKLEQAGAVTLGKANMDEFAMGSSNETSFYGAVKNPWDLSTVPGGSSGGSAAAVAARLAPLASGTDTGGSIRQPAAFCGITGIKPTYGRVSRYGMIAFASSLDQGGAMAKSAEDAAIMLQAMSGFDEKDSTSTDKPVGDLLSDIDGSVKGLTIGLPKEFFGEDLDEEIRIKIEEAVEAFKSAGANVKEISLPNINLSVPAYYVVAPAECSANLSRFDGVRFGHRCDSPKDLEDLYKRSRGEGFGDEVKRRIMMGAYVLSAGYYDAYYKKAQQIRRLIKQDFVEAFKEVDVIASATAPSVAFAAGEKKDDPVSMYLSDIFTIGVNLAGLPGMSVPCGFVDDKPVGMQLIGHYFEEARLLNVAHQYQQLTDWHLAVPSGYEQEA
ncbi:MAG: Asp-tRNA(Asn)/Glu-tRNA(Gln) amidotransferase GatCAB subunit A [Cycloclasticus sp.]|nr:Asp-tRNA(Asn)/Glu-tRNA(Gln) amidotransferase GatCAB subunit A [Cycloclasticus sp.]MBG96622.1 Asp-tRNA(Asn)/Glu-tRNA(Gln) amidotransferase GatCAB subunit A [Cycloclasticus sp.]|tara:strand:- start:107 stop:1570 length:1464 start_codon:yes stop_codon:yes gene_type:complete